tara:strand:- start:355 stop:858 length:504 start_codon:yes stop_codon:yes gene_type:complete
VQENAPEDARARDRRENAPRPRKVQLLDCSISAVEIEFCGGLLPRGVEQWLAHLELVRGGEREVLAQGRPRARHDGVVVLARKVLTAHEGLVRGEIPHGKVAVGEPEHQLAALAPAGEARVEVRVPFEHRALHHLGGELAHKKARPEKEEMSREKGRNKKGSNKNKG